MTPKILRCKICGSDASFLESLRGNWRHKVYDFYSCPACNFLFVGNPDTDYEAIYDEFYYQGKGADPLVDYAYEATNPHSSIRRYEWEGITRWVRSLRKNHEHTKWLDYGCGNGGLVSYAGNTALQSFGFDVCGYDESIAADDARKRGLPVLDRYEYEKTGPVFDVITAIEVLEHTEDPISVLRSIRSKLNKEGVFIYTTGNSLFRPRKLSAWAYVRPEIHISYFQPKTMETALSLAGFSPRYGSLPRGYEDIIRFKILKNLRIKKRSFVEEVFPWRPISFLANLRHGVFDFPVGINIAEESVSR